MPAARTWFGSSRAAPDSRPGKSVCPERLVGRSQYLLRCGIRHCDPPPLEGECRMKTSHDRASTGRGFSLQEDAQRPPRFRKPPTRSFKMPLIQEAPVGLRPTHGGFAVPDAGDSDPCSTFAGFHVGVSVLGTAWWSQTLDRLLRPDYRQYSRPNQATTVPRWVEFVTPACIPTQDPPGGRRSVRHLDLSNQDEYT